MSVKRTIVHEMTTEDLIAMALATDEEVVMDKLTEAAKFIYDLKIKQGNTPVPAQVIYHTYKHWRGPWGNQRPKAIFFRDFGKYFERRRTKDGVFYMLDPKPFDLSEDTYWIIRAEIRRERSRKKK
jgi:hypothetical protein